MSFLSLRQIALSCKASFLVFFPLQKEIAHATRTYRQTVNFKMIRNVLTIKFKFIQSDLTNISLYIK